MHTTTRRRVLVTGAAGFIGANLCRRLISEQQEVHAIVGPSPLAWRLEGLEGLTVYPIDVCDAEGVARVMQSARPNVIYHLATHGAYPFQTDVDAILRINMLGLANVLQASEAIDYELFVHAGSSSEYGRKQQPMRETDDLHPNSIYAVAKCGQSLLCRHWAEARKRPIVVFRLFSAYGPFEEPSRLIPRLIDAMLDDSPIAMASPRTARDFVHVDDVVDAFLRIDQLRAAPGEVLNLGSGIQNTLATVIQTAERIIGRPIRVTWNAMEPRPWDMDTWVADTKTLSRVTGFVPETTLEQGLARSLEWFRSNRARYSAERARVQ